MCYNTTVYISLLLWVLFHSNPSPLVPKTCSMQPQTKQDLFFFAFIINFLRTHSMMWREVLPDIVMLLNVNLVKHHVLLLGINVRFHLHGNMAWKHWEQETFLQESEGKVSSVDKYSMKVKALVYVGYGCLRGGRKMKRKISASTCSDHLKMISKMKLSIHIMPYSRQH